MNKYSFLLKLFLLTFLGFNLYATEVVEQSKYNQKAQTILETIQGLEKSGYITEKNAVEAKKEFVFSKPELLQKEINHVQKVNSDVSWTEYISLINIMKVLAVIFLLIAFKGVVFKFIILFVSIPQYIYQALILSASLMLTFHSDLIWLSQAKYLSIFGVIANILIITWIIATYEDFVKKVFSFISLNFPIEIVASVYATLYFGLFAIYIDSTLLGIIASLSFVSIFGFTMSTTGLTTFIGYDDHEFIDPGLLASLFVVVGYSTITLMGISIPYISVFSIGIEYVLTIVLVITLIIKTSFAFEDDNSFWLNVVLFIFLACASIVTAFLYNFEVIPSIINTGFIMFLLGWLYYFTTKVSGILTMFMVSITLYLSALLLESYPEYFVTTLF